MPVLDTSTLWLECSTFILSFTIHLPDDRPEHNLLCRHQPHPHPSEGVHHQAGGGEGWWLQLVPSAGDLQEEQAEAADAGACGTQGVHQAQED